MGENSGNSWKIPHNLAVQRLAARQFGRVARWQLSELGCSRGWIDGRIASRYLMPEHAGVYAVGVTRDDNLARAMAAVLACGPGALLSHGSAAALWKIREPWPKQMEVTSERDRRRPGIQTHRSTTVRPKDRRRKVGIPVTSPARTLLDIAPRLTAVQRSRAVSDARRNAEMSLGQLRDVLDRNSFHPGTRSLRPFVDRPNGPTRSEFEDAFLALTATYGLPTPQVNVRVNGHEVDALFPEQRLIVELDGWDFHSDREAFTGDRERDADNLDQGYPTVRITWERIHLEPEKEAARLQRILARSYGLLGEPG